MLAIQQIIHSGLFFLGNPHNNYLTLVVTDFEAESSSKQIRKFQVSYAEVIFLD
jgi:hypothetical protein